MSGPKFREVREDRGLTGVELARRLGVDSSLIYKLDAGTRQPSPPLFQAICRELNLADKEELLEPVLDRKAS